MAIYLIEAMHSQLGEHVNSGGPELPRPYRILLLESVPAMKVLYGKFHAGNVGHADLEQAFAARVCIFA